MVEDATNSLDLQPWVLMKWSSQFTPLYSAKKTRLRKNFHFRKFHKIIRRSSFRFFLLVLSFRYPGSFWWMQNQIRLPPFYLIDPSFWNHLLNSIQCGLHLFLPPVTHLIFSCYASEWSSWVIYEFSISGTGTGLAALLFLQRIPLDFLQGERFREAADIYVRPLLTKVMSTIIRWNIILTDRLIVKGVKCTPSWILFTLHKLFLPLINVVLT